MTHRPMPVAAALLASVLLGGCTLGGSEADDDPTGAAPGPGEGQTQEIGETVDVLLAAAGTESVDLSGELPVVATRPASSSYGDFEVDLNGVAVQEELMTVVFTLRVLRVSDSIFSVNDVFDDGTTREGDENGVTAYSTDGVYVLDPAEATRHLVAYDSEGTCVCAVALNSGGGLEEGGSKTFSSTFSAPPESTTTVDVVIPSVGAFTGVTLER
ncbi:hypothetical protein [Aquipuribacter hungaricus]|uniref:Lipoprotein n=1 Tax=Aquipuribacter hungaricus TaxID=545624 RepID=A0ABV7WIQ9_9MICO